jgi:hypothetical protein
VRRSSLLAGILHYPLRLPTRASQVHIIGHTGRHTVGKQLTPIKEGHDHSVTLFGGRLFYLLSESRQTQRRGWGLPNSQPLTGLTWNAIGFERAGKRP